MKTITDTTESPARCQQPIVLQRVAGKTYSTGSYTWAHGREVEWFPNGNYRRKLLGPCPQCGSVTSNYGGAFSCHNDYCPCSANIFACSPGPVPTWWDTQVNVFKDGNAWCATLDSFVNLQESIAGFGDSPQRAVEDLLQNA